MESTPEGFRLEEWMDLHVETSMNMISPPRVTNIPRLSASLTVNLEEGELEVPEASQLDHAIDAQQVASTSVPSQPTYLLPSHHKI